MRKKIFTFLLALTASVGMSWATDPIVIPTNTEQSSYTQGDITITCSKPGDFSGFYLDKSENETATITNSGSSTISQIVLGIGWFPDDRSYVRANGAEPTNSSDPYSITFSNVNSNNVTLTITNGKIQISDVTITLADEAGSEPATGLQVVEVTSELYDGWNSNGNTFSVNVLPGFQAVTFDEAKAWTEVPTSGTAVLVYRTNGDYARVIQFFDGDIMGDYDLETSFNQMYDNITIFGNRIFYTTGGGSTPAPTPSVNAARFVYNYDCQRNPAFPKVNNTCTLSGFKDPYEGYKGYRNGNIAVGPWKLEFVAYYTPSNNYGCSYIVSNAVNQYFMTLSNEEKEAKKLEVPIFRLWQYNLTEREYQPATYGIVCAYAGEANAQDHAALFISTNNMGCFLTGHQHTTSFALTCENDLTTGLADLVAAASASDPELDAIQPILVSIDAIGTVKLSDYCKFLIEGSRAAYNALTDEQKAQITNYNTLVDAEAQWAALVTESQPYANAVIDLINAIPNPVVYTQECKDAIDAAQAAYDALTDNQKYLVTNTETLLQAPTAFVSAAPYVNIIFTADNSNVKRIENVTLPKEFTSGDYSSEIVAIIKELYDIDEEYMMYWYNSSDRNAVETTNTTWTVNPFVDTVRVNGALRDAMYNPQSFVVDITLELPPFGPAPTPTPSGDKLPGVFSVSGTKAVCFSKGNLQYDSDNQIWQFAANQWDYIGNAAGNNAITADGIADNNGIVDMFCWVGASSSLEGIKQYGIIKSWSGYGSVAGEALKSDWGNIMGGDWRTLSKDEWIYLLTERTNAANLRTLGTVNGKAGLILMPDGWTASGVALTVTTANYTTNDINTTNWATLEGQGCAFLPAAGCCALGLFDGVGGDGSYWSSTSRASGATYAHRLHFRATDVDPTDFVDRFNGMSVRLVSETTPTPASADEQVPTNADPVNPSYHYSTFFHSTQNYKLTNDGTQAFIADLSGSDLVLTEIANGTQVIPANTAVILRKAGSADPVVLTPTEENGVSVNPDDNSLEGVDVATPVTDIAGLTTANCYVLSGTNENGVGFYRINSENLKAHKAYVKYVGGPNNAPKKMRFVFNQEQVVTGIDNANADTKAEKRIENGQLIIIKNGVRYNAQGQIVR